VNDARLALDAASAPPSGTITFAFTDIAGSAQRWERERSAMEEAVRRHDAIVRGAVIAHNGYVFKALGDAFCIAFARPEEAVAAMLDVQRALQAEDFSAVDGLRIRAAIHTGTADERDGDYFGPAVNRAARLLAIGHGGQVLVSGVTTDLVQGALPARSSLRDLGEHRLKDLTHPEQVYQLAADGLDATFPPLRSLGALPNNLPLQLTSFVGREDEVAEIVALLDQTRLLTLVGTGGVGKTRTALQVAADVLDGSGDGVWFIDLAPLRDPAFIAPEISTALGLAAAPGKPAIDVVIGHLKSRRMLLIIDNCEHLVEGAAGIIDAILRACPRVSIVATSREGLNVQGERVHRMPSLGVPPAGAITAAEAAGYGAVALFAERARAADGRFTLTDENAPIVAEVCRRLDGIALAIELAAPRVKVLAVEQLSRRLDERFRILTGGSRSALPRQQTMRALIDWSYDLLGENEKLIFRRCGMFVGGFTLEAAAAVCGADLNLDEFEMLELLSTLVDKSLVTAEIQSSQQRYRLLESMREYARARLDEAQESDAIGHAHAQYYFGYAKAQSEMWDVTLPSSWLTPMLPEIDNFRAALRRSLDAGQVIGAELAAVLFRFFDRLGLQREGLRWVELAFSALSNLEPPIRIGLYRALANLNINLGDTAAGLEAAQAELAVAREFGDERQLALSINGLGTVHIILGQLGELRPLAEEALARAERLDDEFLRSNANVLMAISPETDDALRRSLLTDAIATHKRLRRQRDVARLYVYGSSGELRAGNPAEALRWAKQAVDVARTLDTLVLSRSLGVLAVCCLETGDEAQAVTVAREMLEKAALIANPWDVRTAVCILASLLPAPGDLTALARLLGYCSTLANSKVFKASEDVRDAAIERTRTAIGEDAFEKFALEGAAWDEETAYREMLKLIG
jgi:predicted ATPase/class 3 adenylate cyclase